MYNCTFHILRKELKIAQNAYRDFNIKKVNKKLTNELFEGKSAAAKPQTTATMNTAQKSKTAMKHLQ